MSDLEDINYRKMMGECILYYKDKIIGGVYDDRLLIKQTDKAKEMIRDVVYELLYTKRKIKIKIRYTGGNNGK
ncbi:hypothetical protein HMPREF9630_00280 [Peptoanaerobacter stomatis]|uniref:Uncharacterized protein n=1 Tax=Peptoanaerobacter stomatis TaxID=796937 RepID=V9HRV5_9FIRM|nr:hypothetical protein HMPREF9630_00280 [Peptoanaerobacter stomatis]